MHVEFAWTNVADTVRVAQEVARLRTRAMPTERTLARVCREGGATVRLNTKLRDMNVVVHADERAIEILAAGLPIHHGAQLPAEIILRSALTASGPPCSCTAQVKSAVLQKARLDTGAKYVERLHGDRCHLVVVGIETSGIRARAREAPPVLRGSFGSAMQGRLRNAGPPAQRRAFCKLQGRLLNARPSAQCRAVWSLLGRLHNAGPSAQCWAVCTMQGRLLNARPSAQCRTVCSTQNRLLYAGPTAQCKASLLNAGPVCSMQGRSAQCRAGCTMQSCLHTAGPSAQCRAVCTM